MPATTAFAERGTASWSTSALRATAPRRCWRVSPGRHVALAADLADPDAVRRLAGDAAAHLGRVDVLVNNAALFLDPGEGGSVAATTA